MDNEKSFMLKALRALETMLTCLFNARLHTETLDLLVSPLFHFPLAIVRSLVPVRGGLASMLPAPPAAPSSREDFPWQRRPPVKALP